MVAKLAVLLSDRERQRAYLLLLLILLIALVEMLGVSSILPFIAVVTDPGIVTDNRFLSTLYSGMGFSDTHPWWPRW